MSVHRLPVLPARPRTRGECPTVRPCPWVSCRHHLYLDVSAAGTVKVNFPGLEPDELAHSCSLDVQPDVELSLEEAGKRLGVVRESVRLIELTALAKLRGAITGGASVSPPKPPRLGRPAKSMRRASVRVRVLRARRRAQGVCVNSSSHGPISRAGLCEGCYAKCLEYAAKRRAA